MTLFADVVVHVLYCTVSCTEILSTGKHFTIIHWFSTKNQSKNNIKEKTEDSLVNKSSHYSLS